MFDGGGQVFVRRDVAGLPWPAVDVYQYIDALPEQAAAVFFDYGQHRTYIPGVRQSRVSAIVDPSTPLTGAAAWAVAEELTRDVCAFAGIEVAPMRRDVLVIVRRVRP